MLRPWVLECLCSCFPPLTGGPDSSITWQGRGHVLIACEHAGHLFWPGGRGFILPPLPILGEQTNHMLIVQMKSTGLLPGSAAPQPHSQRCSLTKVCYMCNSWQMTQTLTSSSNFLMTYGHRISQTQPYPIH